MGRAHDDETRRRRLEEALQQSEQRFERLVEAAKDYAIFMTDAHGRVSTWNEGAQRLFGYAEAEIVGEGASLLFTPEDRECGIPERELQKARTEGRAEDERWHMCNDGSRFWASGMELGASAYLVKTSSSEHLVAAVRAAVFDPRAKNAVVGMPPAMLEESRDGVEGVLSARELELLLLAARGLSNREIAASANLAEATVKRHLANVYNKMGVSSRTEASREALTREWITIEEITHSEPPLT